MGYQQTHIYTHKGKQEAANGQDSCNVFTGMHRALDIRILARASASPAQGLHCHGPRYSNFHNFFMTCGLEKLGLVDQN